LLKKGLDSLIREITHYKRSDSYEVRWRKIDENHPIFNTNYKTIRNYVEALKLEYMEKMNVNKDRCDTEFIMNAKLLDKLVEIFDNHFTNEEIEYTGSIRLIIRCNNWDEIGKHYAEVIKAILKDLCLPVYTQIKEVDEVLDEGISLDAKSIKRELFIERTLLDEIRKREDVERENKLLIDLLSRFMPEGYDISGLLLPEDVKRKLLEIK